MHILEHMARELKNDDLTKKFKVLTVCDELS